MMTETTPIPEDEIKRARDEASDRLRDPISRAQPAFAVTVEVAFDDLRRRFPRMAERDVLLSLDPDKHADHARILRSA